MVGRNLTIVDTEKLKDLELVTLIGNMYVIAIGQALRNDIVSRVTYLTSEHAFRLGQDAKFQESLNILDKQHTQKTILEVFRAYEYCMRLIQ